MIVYDNPILIAAAVIPAIFLVIQINRADRLEKEPIRLIIALVIWGAVSTLLAAFSEEIGILILTALFPENSLIYNLILNFVVVGCSEEGFKYLLLKKKTWKSPEFNCQFDGVVYAVCISLGFALWENIGYVGQYGIGTALVRAVTAVPGHGCFGVFMGAFYGMARRYENFGESGKSRSCRRLAILVPVLLHGTYDYIATVEEDLLGLAFLVFVGAMFFAASRMVRKLSRSDRFIRARYEGLDW